MGPEFWLTALALSAIPGTGAIFTMTTGIAHGGRAGVSAAVGCALGILPHVVLAASGLAALLLASSVAFEILKWLGVAYLLFLAVRTWRDSEHFSDRPTGPPPSALRTIGLGFLVNALNPKVPIFFLVFLPRLLDVSGPTGRALTLAGGLAFVVLTLGTFTLYGLAAGWLRPKVLVRPRAAAWTRRGFAGVFALLAGRLALQTR
ncbi:MAG: lysine transporter LysE [Naasia sp.]|nr:lysine transporter LysE [Naasia sp.]